MRIVTPNLLNQFSDIPEEQKQQAKQSSFWSCSNTHVCKVGEQFAVITTSFFDRVCASLFSIFGCEYYAPSFAGRSVKVLSPSEIQDEEQRAALPVPQEVPNPPPQPRVPMRAAYPYGEFPTLVRLVAQTVIGEKGPVVALPMEVAEHLLQERLDIELAGDNLVRFQNVTTLDLQHVRLPLTDAALDHILKEWKDLNAIILPRCISEDAPRQWQNVRTFLDQLTASLSKEEEFKISVRFAEVPIWNFLKGCSGTTISYLVLVALREPPLAIQYFQSFHAAVKDKIAAYCRHHPAPEFYPLTHAQGIASHLKDEGCAFTAFATLLFAISPFNDTVLNALDPQQKKELLNLLLDTKLEPFLSNQLVPYGGVNVCHLICKLSPTVTEFTRNIAECSHQAVDEFCESYLPDDSFKALLTTQSNSDELLRRIYDKSMPRAVSLALQDPQFALKFLEAMRTASECGFNKSDGDRTRAIASGYMTKRICEFLVGWIEQGGLDANPTTLKEFLIQSRFVGILLSDPTGVYISKERCLKAGKALYEFLLKDNKNAPSLDALMGQYRYAPFLRIDTVEQQAVHLFLNKATEEQLSSIAEWYKNKTEDKRRELLTRLADFLNILLSYYYGYSARSPLAPKIQEILEKLKRVWPDFCAQNIGQLGGQPDVITLLSAHEAIQVLQGDSSEEVQAQRFEEIVQNLRTHVPDADIEVCMATFLACVKDRIDIAKRPYIVTVCQL